MIHGMTGFGRGEATREGLRVAVDVRTVNHRFLDVEIRGAQLPAALESRLRKEVSARLARGRVEVGATVELEELDPAALHVNRALVRALVHTLQDVARDLGVAGEVTMDQLAALPWGRALELGAPALAAPAQEAVVEALQRALDDVVAHRRSEGVEVLADLSARAASLRASLGLVRDEAASAGATHLARLRQRLADLIAGHALDEGRLLQEAALLAERTDVSEEVARLSAHLERLEEVLAGDSPCGKRLDFTLQEALREVNTMGAKSRGMGSASAVIDMKCELERMREQAANVE